MLYCGLEAASSDVSFGKAHEEEAGHDGEQGLPGGERQRYSGDGER